MKTNTKKALSISKIPIIFFFLIAFVSNLTEESLVVALTNGVVGSFFFGGLSFLTIRKTLNCNIQVDRWWKWIFYLLGWIALLTPIFWIIFLPWHFIKDSSNPFFNKRSLNKIIYPFGKLFFLVFVSSLIFKIFSLYLVTPDRFPK